VTTTLSWRSLPPALTPVSLSAIGRYALRPNAARHLESLRVELERRFGRSILVGTDSGTSALRLAIESSVRTGGLVALPAYGCFDLITAVVGAERRAILYDLDVATLAPRLESLAEALAAGAESVVVAPIFGYAPPMTEIAELCSRFGATLIEDIAQGVGASYTGRPLGSWGELVTLSFGRGKGIGGAGGGALLVREPAAFHLAALPPAPPTSAWLGVAKLLAQSLLGRPELFALPSALPFLRLGETIYHEPWAPWSLHPLQAALAAEALGRDESRRQQRALVAREIEAHLAGVSALQSITVAPMAQAGFLRFGIRAPAPLIAGLAPLGARRAYPIPLHLHRSMRSVLVGVPAVPGAGELASSLASLPTHHLVSRNDIARLGTLVRAA
jgi:perosamine synthetase